MWIIISATSILVIATITRLANKALPFKICSICAGVSGTWAWLLAGRWLGYPIDVVVLGLLMGGSVVGIAYQVEKRRWKTLFIPLGFIAAYSLIFSWWTAFGLMILLLSLLFLVFVKKPRGFSRKDEKEIAELEEKMKKCC